jgi:hypothetical protein
MGRQTQGGNQRGSHPLVGLLNPFYVYILSRPDGRPFYVGMGTGKRMYWHEQNAYRERSYKASIIRSILANGGAVGYRIVETFPTVSEALALEIELILAIGRRDLRTGPLSNLTAGGEGVINLSEALRAKHRAETKRAMASPEMREQCRAHMRKLRTDPVWVAARNAEIKAFWQNEQNRASQSKRVKARFADPDERRKSGDLIRAALNNPTSRAKMRAAKLGKKQSPEVIARRAQSLSKPRVPGTGARISAGKRAAAQRKAQLAGQIKLIE